MKRFCEVGHRGLVALVLAGAVFQFYAAWLLITGLPQVHQTAGWVLILLSVVAIPLSAVGFGWRHEKFRLTIGLTVLLILQPILALAIAPLSQFVAAVHPLNALVILWVALRLLGRTISRA